MRVFSFVASCRGTESVTARFSDLAADRLATHAAKIGETVEYERIRGDQLSVGFCRSCENCFRKGVCPLDRSDDLSMLKQKILEADILLFCSPVYAGTMSGMAKAVIDRLAYWMHRGELAGKTAAALVTTSNNFGDETAQQLGFALRMMGAAVAYEGAVSRHIGRVNIHLPNQLDPELDSLSESLFSCYQDPAAYIDSSQDRNFAARSREYRHARAITDLADIEPRSEMLVWEERGFLRYPSLSDYVRTNGPLFPREKA